MSNVLLVTSSPRGEASYSSAVATELAGRLAEGGELVVRELWREGLAPMSPALVHAMFTPEADRTAEQRELLAPSDTAVAQIQAADTVVIAAGMINFGMPAVLKSWIDLISRRGATFVYTESGPTGLLTGKRLILVLATGGVYSTGPMAAMDHLESALRSNFGFLGFTDIETIWIEGVAFGEEAANAAIDRAKARSRELAGAVPAFA